jgi:hypothetical protein
MYRALCSVNLLAGPHDIANALASGTLHECRVHITAHRARRRAAMAMSGQHLRSTPFEYFGAQVGRWRHDGGEAVEFANRASCLASYSTRCRDAMALVVYPITVVIGYFGEPPTTSQSRAVHVVRVQPLRPLPQRSCR